MRLRYLRTIRVPPQAADSPDDVIAGVYELPVH